jgi:hypothetical protein
MPLSSVASRGIAVSTIVDDTARARRANDLALSGLVRFRRRQNA